MCLRKAVVIEDTQQNLSQFTPFYLAFSFMKPRQWFKNLAGSSERHFIKKKIRSTLSLSFCASQMIKLSDVTSVLGFHLENDSSLEVREEGKQITRLSIILCPSAARKLDIDPELPSPRRGFWVPCWEWRWGLSLLAVLECKFPNFTNKMAELKLQK